MNHQDIVNERGSHYGLPEDNHQCTADFWRVWAARRYGDSTKGPQDALDTIVFNLFQKLSRGAYRWKDDNWIDFKGYAENALMLPNHCRNLEPGVDGYESPLRDEEPEFNTFGDFSPTPTDYIEALKRVPFLIQDAIRDRDPGDEDPGAWSDPDGTGTP